MRTVSVTDRIYDCLNNILKQADILKINLLIMKKILMVISGIIFLSSCSQKNPDNTEKWKQEIAKADIAMSDLSAKEGFFRALSKYATDDFVKFSSGNHPIIGKKEFDDSTKNDPGPLTLSWSPEKTEVAASGDLGYTWGNWKFAVNDTTTRYGNYFTVWRKQDDGSWKMALDGGNGTPPPR